MRNASLTLALLTGLCFPGPIVLAETCPSAARVLQEAGYTPGFVGKWHTGIPPRLKYRADADMRDPQVAKVLPEDPRRTSRYIQDGGCDHAESIDKGNLQDHAPATHPGDRALDQLKGFFERPGAHRYHGVRGIAPLQKAIRKKLHQENGIHIPLESTSEASCLCVTAGANVAFMNAISITFTTRPSG